MESHSSSAAAFVEGGVQDACDDSCSICLEAFSDSDPSTVTSCKHEFHLQCILEWCQRSSQCPMCWQPISFKDSLSQELLTDVESERSMRLNRERNSTIFQHPAFVDFDLQHLPVAGSDAELEERIFQHLAAAAAMGRAHRVARRGQRGRSGSHGRPQYLIFSTHPDAPSTGSSTSTAQGENESVPAIIASSQLASATIQEESANQDRHVLPTRVDLASVASMSPSRIPSRTTAGHSTPVTQNRSGPLDFQSFSESLKSRLNAVSVRYKESITKSTRGWREKLFSRNSTAADLGSEVRREVNSTVSRTMESLEAREPHINTDSHAAEAHPFVETSNETTRQVQNIEDAAQDHNLAISQPNEITTAGSHLASSSAN